MLSARKVHVFDQVSIQALSVVGLAPAEEKKMTTSLYRGTQRPVRESDAWARSRDRMVSDEQGEWITQARCRRGDPDALFVRGAQQRKAVAVCRHCPVLEPCRVEALNNREEYGVWGGMTERQRRALLREHPHVDNWAGYLTTGDKLSES